MNAQMRYDLAIKGQIIAHLLVCRTLLQNYTYYLFRSHTTCASQRALDAWLIDLLVTKAGGITIFEAINASTPLYILRPFLAQEIGNAEYIEQNNIGQVMWTKYSDASSDILSLLNNPSLLRTMKKNMDEIRRSWHSYDAVSYFANGEEGV